MYKDEWSIETTMDYMRKESGKFFDPEVVRCLERILPEILAVRDEENRLISEEQAQGKRPGSPR